MSGAEQSGVRAATVWSSEVSPAGRTSYVDAAAPKLLPLTAHPPPLPPRGYVQRFNKFHRKPLQNFLLSRLPTIGNVRLKRRRSEMLDFFSPLIRSPGEFLLLRPTNSSTTVCCTCRCFFFFFWDEWGVEGGCMVGHPSLSASNNAQIPYWDTSW